MRWNGFQRDSAEWSVDAKLQDCLKCWRTNHHHLTVQSLLIACSTVDSQNVFILFASFTFVSKHTSPASRVKREFANRKPVSIKIRNCRTNKKKFFVLVKRDDEDLSKLVRSDLRLLRVWLMTEVMFTSTIFLTLARARKVFYSPSRFHSPRPDLGLHFEFLSPLRFPRFVLSSRARRMTEAFMCLDEWVSRKTQRRSFNSTFSCFIYSRLPSTIIKLFLT